MLTVDFKQKIGEFTVVEKCIDGEQTFKICIHPCNALAAFIYHYVRKEDNEKYARLYAFFNNKTHMMNIEKYHPLERPFFNIKGVVKLNMAYKESNDLLGFFARQGHTIKPYYKQPKQPKK